MKLNELVVKLVEIVCRNVLKMLIQQLLLYVFGFLQTSGRHSPSVSNCSPFCLVAMVCQTQPCCFPLLNLRVVEPK